MSKKIVSKTKYIINMFISFIIWSLVLWCINIFLSKVFISINDTVYVIYNLFLYTIEGILLIPLCYISNRKIRVAKYESEKEKIFVLIMFYILLVFIGLDDITEGVLKSPVLFSAITILKLVSITFINEIMFKRSMKDEKK